MFSRFIPGKEKQDSLEQKSTTEEGSKQENIVRAGLLRELNKLLVRVEEAEELHKQLVTLACKVTSSPSGFLMVSDYEEWNVVHAREMPEASTRHILATIREMELEGVIGADTLINLKGLASPEGRDDAPGTIANFLGVCFAIPGSGESWGVLGVANSTASQEYAKDMEWLISYLGVMAGTLLYFNRSLESYSRSQQDAFLALLRALEARDPYTSSRRRIVSSLCAKVAQRIDMTARERDVLNIASQLYDVGMIAVPDRILLKEGALNKEELEQMRSHVLAVVKILSGIHSIPHLAIDIIKAHHERYDGTGYPFGLKGDDIPLGARVIHVCQAYEALTSNRPYRPGLTREVALERMAECAGTQFDPEILSAFVKVL